MDERPAPTWDYPPSPPSPPGAPLEPARPARRSTGWRGIGIVTLVLLVAASAVGLVWQQSQLRATRSDLAAVRTSASTQNARLDTLQNTADAQQQSLASLSTQVATAKTQLQAAQSGLLSAQTKLQADEKQLNLTTSQLPPDLPALAAKVTPSVVLVTCTLPGELDSGTGFALALTPSPGFNTTIITAAHVLTNCSNPSNGNTLALSAGTAAFDVKIRVIDTTNDVAILDTTAKLPALEASSVPVVGEFLMAVGHPLGNTDNNVTSGNVSDVYSTFFLDSAPVSSGNSGGPVVDRNGKVVGIVDKGGGGTAGQTVIENLNLSLRLSTLCLRALHGAGCATLH